MNELVTIVYGINRESFTLEALSRMGVTTTDQLLTNSTMRAMLDINGDNLFVQDSAGEQVVGNKYLEVGTYSITTRSSEKH